LHIETLKRSESGNRRPQIQRGTIDVEDSERTQRIEFREIRKSVLSFGFKEGQLFDVAGNIWIETFE
jgi:hypothetical protein